MKRASVTCWQKPSRCRTTTWIRRRTAEQRSSVCGSIVYDLLIVDLKMPGIDGLSVIREAKRLKADIPVIVITGFSTESAAIEALNLGVTSYLTKPFRVPQVLAAAAKAIGRSIDLAVVSTAFLQSPKSFGERVLLEDVTWQISTGERVGLCGPNGAGKTTLLKMLAGLDEPDTGSIIKPSALTVGYLPQDGLAHAGRSILDEASAAFADLLNVKLEMHDIEDAWATHRSRRMNTTRCSSATAPCRIAFVFRTATTSI